MSDILFIKTSSLGDVIHQMPALTEARRRLPQARFSWVVEEAFAPLVRLHPAVSEVIPVATRRWRQALFSPANWRDMARFTSTLRRQPLRSDHRHPGPVPLGGACAGRAWPSPWLRRRQRARTGGGRALRRSPSRAARSARDRAQPAADRSRAGLSARRAASTSAWIARVLAQRPDGYGILLHATARAEKEWPEDRWMALGEALGPDALIAGAAVGQRSERMRSVRIAAALGRPPVCRSASRSTASRR